MTAPALADEFRTAQTLLNDLAHNTRSVFAFCNADGNLTHIDGPRDALSDAADANFTVGAKLWYGTHTNCLRSVFDPRGTWFYSAAPISDWSTGAVAGAVVLASRDQHASNGTVQLLRACATAIAGHIAIKSPWLTTPSALTEEA